MGQDKKQLTKLLAFVKDLYDNPDNKEFAAGIQSIVQNDSDFVESLQNNPSIWYPEAIQNIEKYLSLDYRLDFKDFPDYSFIEDETIRIRLLSDFREMLRYEYGTRNHKIDFPEFCRYAALQVEMLINYFYDKIFKFDFLAIKRHIQGANPKYTFNDKVKKVSDIALKTKIYRSFNDFGMKPALILNTIEARNRQSHRSLKADKDFILEAEQLLKKQNGWIQEWDRPNFKTAREILGEDDYKEYQFEVFLDAQPFKEITEAIRTLVENIRFCKVVEAVVSNALPSALYIMFSNKEIKEVPDYNYKEHFAVGMKVLVTITKAGNIIKVSRK